MIAYNIYQYIIKMDENLWLFQHIENEHGNYVRQKINEEIENVEKAIRIINENIRILNNNLRQNLTPEQKKQFIENLQKHYMLEDEFNKKRKNLSRDKYNIYICCSPEVRTFLLGMGSKLKHAMPKIELDDIYIALILVAYSLLGEQYYDMIKIRDMTKDTENVFLGITSGDIMYNDENLSSEIRQFFILGNRNRDNSDTDTDEDMNRLDIIHSINLLLNDSDSDNYKTPPDTSPKKLNSPSPVKRKTRTPSSSPITRKRQRTHSGGKKKLRRTKRQI